MKQELEPIVLSAENSEKGMVYTGSGVEKVKAIEVEYYNKDNDRSVYNMVTPRIREKLGRPSVQENLLLDEWELKEIIKPTPTLNRLRISFWREFDRAQTKNTDMKMVKIYAGICPKEQFEKYLGNDHYTTWILKPPVDYVNAMEEALMFGVDRLREIIELPFIQTKHMKIKTGQFEEEIVTYQEFEPKIADIILKTVAMLDMRVKGALVQKVEQKVVSENRNVNASLTANIEVGNHNEVKQNIAGQIGVNDIDGEIKRLEQQISKDVKKVGKPYTATELRSIDKNGININEIPLDANSVKALQDKDEVENKVGPKPPRVTDVGEVNPVEIERVEDVLGEDYGNITDENSDILDNFDIDLGDL